MGFAATRHGLHLYKYHEGSGYALPLLTGFSALKGHEMPSGSKPPYICLIRCTMVCVVSSHSSEIRLFVLCAVTLMLLMKKMCISKVVTKCCVVANLTSEMLCQKLWTGGLSSCFTHFHFTLSLHNLFIIFYVNQYGLSYVYFNVLKGVACF